MASNKNMRWLKEKLFHLRSRIKAEHPIRSSFFFIVLLIKKLLRIDFKDKHGIVDTPEISLVIPTVSKDFDLLDKVISNAIRYVHPRITQVFIVSPVDEQIQSFCERNGYTHIDENSVLGYGKSKIKYIVKSIDRSGWIFQQLLKLSGNVFVQTRHYLIVDSDTILINPHTFITNGKSVFLMNEEWNEPYFKTFKRMFNYPAPAHLSLTSHMMIFDTVALREMKLELENRHKMSWDEAYLSMLDPNEVSCISDYETYGNWFLNKYPEKTALRIFYNRSFPRGSISIPELEAKYKNKYKSLSFHSYIKK